MSIGGVTSALSGQAAPAPIERAHGQDFEAALGVAWARVSAASDGEASGLAEARACAVTGTAERVEGTGDVEGTEGVGTQGVEAAGGTGTGDVEGMEGVDAQGAGTAGVEAEGVEGATEAVRAASGAEGRAWGLAPSETWPVGKIGRAHV